ncbi:MAG: fumarate hydratase C-terminal domain-containing protein [Candidatus Omnitrophica bacterium]|nr:fumarate hydratase C-terminal domain-containing protein [Candidatus Omnitrophota bacterium]
MKKIYTPLSQSSIKSLKAGDEVLLSGVIYTARDLAHQQMLNKIVKGKRPPIPLKGQVIYYCGPTTAPKKRVIGSCGPTTSSRMDAFTPALLRAGLLGMIGKGSRDSSVKEAIRRHRAVYFLAIGGAGALLASKVKECRVVAYKEFGPEAIYELKVDDFPLIVGIDSRGGDIFRLCQKGG